MKNSFRDPVTNVLKAWGCTESNGEDIAREESDDFDLEPGKWMFEGGQWVPCLVGAKPAKLTAINAECDRLINVAVASYPEMEKLTFAKQESEARAFVANSVAPTPMMDALAMNRGITKVDLANRIIAKADFFATYAGEVIGHRQKLEDRVNAPNADLSDIDPLAGWPA
jgi:hypothetical protein